MPGPDREVFKRPLSTIHLSSASSNALTEAERVLSQLGSPSTLPAQRQQIMRQAYAGLLWTKQFYHYVVETWLDGDPNGPQGSTARMDGRNSDWRHLFNRDIISMPDKWEYPWYAAWDLAFHMVPMAHLDNRFAKDQMILFLREWYMHPSGQIPAYEWQLERCQSARARMGCLAGLQSIGSAQATRQVVSRSRLSKVADQFHLVGQPKGPAGQEYLCRWLFGFG